MTELHVIFTRGMQASGKSTWAEKFVSENQNYKRCSRDLLRTMASNYTYDEVNEKLISAMEIEAIKTIIDAGYNLVIDNMHLSEKTIDKTTQWISEYASKQGFTTTFEVKEFPITLAEAIERDAKRARPLGKSVLKNTWGRFEIELKQMLERAKPSNSSNPDGVKSIIVDIDGTLAKATNRLIFDESRVMHDSVIPQVRDIVNAAKGVYNYKIIILSGRSDSSRDVTEQWLGANGICFDAVYMRRTGDYRPDTEVKKEIYDNYIKANHNIMWVVDDRPCVVALWVSLGLFVFNVNQDPYCKNNF